MATIIQRGSYTLPKPVRKRSNDATISQFIEKLHEMVEDGRHNLIGWNTSGDGFVISNDERFTNEVIPVYFKHKNFSSFARQLNFYDFNKVMVHDEVTGQRVSKRPTEYTHPFFIREHPDMLSFIVRKTNSSAMAALTRQRRAKLQRVAMREAESKGAAPLANGESCVTSTGSAQMNDAMYAYTKSQNCYQGEHPTSVYYTRSTEKDEHQPNSPTFAYPTNDNVNNLLNQQLQFSALNPSSGRMISSAGWLTPNPSTPGNGEHSHAPKAWQTFHTLGSSPHFNQGITFNPSTPSVSRNLSGDPNTPSPGDNRSMQTTADNARYMKSISISSSAGGQTGNSSSVSKTIMQNADIVSSTPQQAATPQPMSIVMTTRISGKAIAERAQLMQQSQNISSSSAVQINCPLYRLVTTPNGETYLLLAPSTAQNNTYVKSSNAPFASAKTNAVPAIDVLGKESTREVEDSTEKRRKEINDREGSSKQNDIFLERQSSDAFEAPGSKTNSRGLLHLPSFNSIQCPTFALDNDDVDNRRLALFGAGTNIDTSFPITRQDSTNLQSPDEIVLTTPMDNVHRVNSFTSQGPFSRSFMSSFDMGGQSFARPSTTAA